jgi:hypothetical protein
MFYVTRTKLLLVNRLSENAQGKKKIHICQLLCYRPKKRNDLTEFDMLKNNMVREKKKIIQNLNHNYKITRN